MDETQTEYINHLAYLLFPIIEKLPEDVTTSIQDLLGLYGAVPPRAEHLGQT